MNYYFLVVVNSDMFPTEVVSEHASLHDASLNLLWLFNSLYECHFKSWKDALTSSLSHNIFLWEMTNDVMSFQINERFYDIIYKPCYLIKGSSLSLIS